MIKLELLNYPWILGFSIYILAQIQNHFQMVSVLSLEQWKINIWSEMLQPTHGADEYG